MGCVLACGMRLGTSCVLVSRSSCLRVQELKSFTCVGNHAESKAGDQVGEVPAVVSQVGSLRPPSFSKGPSMRIHAAGARCSKGSSA